MTEFVTPINEDLRLIQRRGDLTFGTDAYLLGAFVRSMPRERAAEFGGGSGVVSLLCAARGRFARILCAELRPDLTDLIRRNAELNGLSDVIEALSADVRELTVRDTGGELSAVFSNPPYFRAGSGRVSGSPDLRAARSEENGTIRDFCASASRLLRWGGLFTLVYRPERLTELLFSLRSSSLEPKRIVFVHPVSDAPPSLVLVEVYRDGSKSVYTDDMRRVYDDFSLDHLF